MTTTQFWTLLIFVALPLWAIAFNLDKIASDAKTIRREVESHLDAIRDAVGRIESDASGAVIELRRTRKAQLGEF